jgi:cytochrome b561/polyisoprenoid-binding protein YceI
MATTNSIDAPDISSAAQARYSTGAIVLHWLIALALAFQLALGFAMPHDERGFALFQLHKSVGITILLLTLARLGWRLTHRPPPAVEGGFQGFLAKAVHFLLYAFMIGAPLTGWALASTDPTGIPTLLYGSVPWPHLPLPGAFNEAFEEAHELLAWIGLALIVLHVAGALRHQLLLRDGLLRRMGPGGSAWAAGLLALLAVGLYFGTGMKIASDVVAMGGYAPEGEHEHEREHSHADTPAAAPSPTAEPVEAATPAAEEAVAVEEEAAEEAAEEALEETHAPPPVWTIQPGKRLGFSVGNGDGAISGTFSDWSGTIRFDPDHPETAEIRISVSLASASLGDATQDEMVRGPDFFGVSANPTATWRSTSVRRTAPNRYSANGTLSLKGVSRAQPLTFTLSGEGLRRSVEGRASIDRGAFGVGTGEAAAGLANSVTLNFAFDAVGRAP